jgi:hypothetical protein
VCYAARVRTVQAAVWGLALVAGCSGPGGGADGTSESAFSKADFPEARVLPYAGAWLDVRATLSGLDQFDRLSETVHDGDRCGAMVAIAAAVVGGADAFEALLAHVEARRAPDAADAESLRAIRARLEARTLRARDVHVLADCVMRAYAPHSYRSGSSDGEEASMIRAAGWVGARGSSKSPASLLAALGPGDVVPLSLDVSIDDKGWHWILGWRDQGGALFLYDSDDVPGPHVHAEGSASFDARVNNPTAAFDLRETFHR